MASVADCLRQHAPAYLEKFGNAVPLGHRKVLSAITRCRTGELGGVVYQCDGCGREHWVGRSCGNRHCPNCQKEKTQQWLAKQTGRLLPVHHFLVTFTVPWELRRIVRSHQKVCYDALFAAGSQTSGDGQAVLKYLAPYVYRVAISDKRIVDCDQSSVTFSYTPSKSNKRVTRTLDGEQFVGGFLQHVLPTGLQKIRYYGWMSTNSRIGLDEVRWLVWLFLGWTYWLGSGHAPQPQPHQRQTIRCAACGGVMRIVQLVLVNCRVLVEHGVPYLDSG